MKRAKKSNTELAYQQKIDAQRKERLAMPPTFEWKPLTKLPVAPYQRPTYSAPGCVIRSIHDGKVLA
jgi:hypothetical protein